MSSSPNRLLTPQEYLAIERSLPTKHEFYRGEMFAMSGASRKHNLIAWNLGSSLHGQLKDRPCEAYLGDMRVNVPTTGLYTYPDLVVTCDEPRFEDNEFDTLLNPQVVIEVVSDSTEAYDRGKKFKQYMEIESLRDYILVAQNYASIDHYTRDDQGNWSIRQVNGLGAELEISTIHCKLPLADIYAKVEFPPESEINKAAGIFSDDEPR